MTQIATFERDFDVRTRQRPARPSGSVRALAVDWDGLQAWREGWMELARRALDANIFADPLFLTAALQHVPPARRPVFVVTFDEAEPDRLTGVFPLHIPRRALGSIARVWFNPMMANGAPLIDAARAPQAIRELFAWMQQNHPNIRALMFPALGMEGASAQAIQATAKALAAPVRVFDERSRAVVSADLWQAGSASSRPPCATGKELRRLRRRLGEQGDLTYVSARTPNDIRPALERFLALESSGWKGRRGTGLLCDPSTATFARALVRHLARRGRCRIDALELNGKPIAMGIVLLTGERAVYWKTCFDENFSRFSPGSIFSLEMTDAVLGDDDVTTIDSCAIENHPMIDRLWRERATVADIAIAIPGGSSIAFNVAMAMEAARRRARALLKKGFYAATGRKPN
jgi:CelD/BcsL family acetyltransferase involved in cellulose biosynthesis